MNEWPGEYQPLINRRFLLMPSNLLRLSGEFLKTSLKPDSVSSSQSLVEKFNTCGSGENCTSLWGLLNRFHGQTSWQTSQPNIHSSNRPFSCSGRSASFNSIVK